MVMLIPRDSSDYLRYLIGRARLAMFRVRQKELAPHRISPEQANVLFILYNHDHGLTLAELAWQIDRKINTLSIQLTRMEKDKLVKKIRTTPKSNRLKFELTKKGVVTYKTIEKIGSVKEIMSVITEEERLQIISTLEKIINQAEKYI